MLSKILTASIQGIEAKPVFVETDISKGLPALNIVGLGDTTVKEARERIRLAIQNSGIAYPNSRITVNLSPANVKKKGSHFDLAMAVGIMASSRLLFDGELEKYCFIGELSLDGGINRVEGILPMVLAMRKQSVKKVIIPMGNREEALLVQDMEIYPAEDLESVINHFNYKDKLKVYINEERNISKLALPKRKLSLDYSDIMGEESAKRAISIAVAGNHGIIMTGSPGTGKTMISERIPTIMPEMTYDEILETTVIYSVAGNLSEEIPYIIDRPFRQPHHRITPAGLIGGGGNPKPGEISLANKGVLFLDEIGEYDRNLIELLRLPLEKKKINIFRGGINYVFPADFMLVAATNPCKCGYYGDPTHQCKCTAGEIERYRAKLSGPILDRIDMSIELTPITYNQLNGTKTESSLDMKMEIERVRKVQRERYAKEGIQFNSQLEENQIEKFCHLKPEGNEMMERAFSRLGLNPRTFWKVLKVARTVADFQQSEEITTAHIGEALQYRMGKEN